MREFIKAIATEVYPNTVVCINRPADLFVSLVKNKNRLLTAFYPHNIRYIKDNLILFRPFFFINDCLGSWLPFVNQWQALWLRSMLRRMGFLSQGEEVITWLFSSIHWPFAELCPFSSVVYHPVDEYTVSFDGHPIPRAIEIEKSMMARCQTVFTVNESLTQKKRQLHSNVYTLGHGVDVGLFSQALASNTEIPLEIRQIPQPRIGLVGNLRSWIDFALVEGILQSHPEWSIIFIGPKDPSAVASIDSMGKYKNFFWLGPKPYSDLYLWLKGLDVGIIPYQKTEFTRFVNPYKMYEYWAAGLPVVTTRIGGFEPNPHCLWVADTPEQFRDHLAQALNDTGGSAIVKRLELARAHSWESMAQRALSILNVTTREHS